jgi:CrcB protein
MIELGPGQLVGLGGAAGAVLRYLVSEAVADREYPSGTLLVNVVGSFLLGLVTFAGVGGDASLLVGVGGLGAFTTFSSFSYETVRLWETGDRRRAIYNLVGTFGGTSAAVLLAWGLVVLMGIG